MEIEKSYYSASDFYKNKFGCKVYKIAIDAGCTCPTRDGTKGFGGCIFCSQAGSGDFASSRNMTISEQIEEAKLLVNKKLYGRSGQTSCGKYIAYFQNFTNTYGDYDELGRKYKEAVSAKDVVGISIATRPDCLDDDILIRIASLSKQTFVSIELGFQTSNENTAKYIRREYKNEVYDDAVLRIKKIAPQIHIVTHVIFGLPGETKDDMLNTVRYVVAKGTDGIKMTVLFVLEETDLATEYRAGKFDCMSKEDYYSVVTEAIKLIPKNIVVHRLTGDPPKKILIAPLWTADKRRIHNEMEKLLRKNDAAIADV